MTAAGAVRLPSARITGQLNMRDVLLTGTDKKRHSLLCDGLQVDGSVFLERLTAAGAVRLPGARITRELSMIGAQLTGADQKGYSLDGADLQVGHTFFLDGASTATGAIDLSGARLGVLQLDVGGLRKARHGPTHLLVSSWPEQCSVTCGWT